MSFFDRVYTVRRFGKPKNVSGHQTSGYADITCSLNVQEEDPDEMTNQPEGQRTSKKLKSWGCDKFLVADSVDRTNADRLLYEKRWYECTSCVHLDHTFLKHYCSSWTRLPEGSDRYISD